MNVIVEKLNLQNRLLQYPPKEAADLAKILK
jgi:hypothetical protein